MKAIKNKTYYNFMRVLRMMEKKGYDRKTAEELTRQIFDQYESNPAGFPVLALVDRVLTKSEYENEYR